MQQPLIFDIKRYAINDGPGIRVTIFFKGCPLHCRWCHNPESIAPQAQKLFTAGRCLGCGACVKSCPAQACQLTRHGILTRADRCSGCGECARRCPSQATEMSGKLQSVAQLLEILEKEQPFFDQSGGGVTFSGGEPLRYPEFLRALLEGCGRRQIHRCIDTAGLVDTSTLLAVAEQTELFLYDLKLLDSAKHRQWTGVGNELILHNLQALAESGAKIRIRIPLIGGVNADEETLNNMAAFIAALPGPKKPSHLLPYHNLAGGKEQKLGRRRGELPLAAPSSAEQLRAIRVFASYGLKACLGG
jgi:pyruvate formate lyase activating enzyme